MSCAPGVIFITCQSLTSDIIFNNGLNQNILILYKLFELLKYTPYLLVNGPINISKLAKEYIIFEDLRYITLDKYIQRPFNIKVLLEIGVNMSKKVRGLFHMMGAKIIKLYLGNTLNIDTEMSLFMPKSDLVQHYFGDLDLVLTSPHYDSQLDYLRKINGVKKADIAPYVWSPMFIANNVPRGNPKDILIFEPNISFQKCCVVPLLICEKYYEKNPSFDGNIHVFNSDKYEECSNLFKNLLERLSLWKNGHIVLHGRHSVNEILNKYPESIILCHQTNNEYNYMYLEAFYKKIPLVHNAECWSNGGFYYKENNIDDGARALQLALSNQERDFSEEKKIIETYSIYNTANQQGWLRLLEDTT